MKKKLLSSILMIMLACSLSACSLTRNTNIKNDTLVIAIDDKSYTTALSIDRLNKNAFANILICDKYNNDTITVVDIIGNGIMKTITAEKLKKYKLINSCNIINVKSFKELEELVNLKEKKVYVVHRYIDMYQNKNIRYYKEGDKTVTLYEAVMNYKNTITKYE